MKSEQDKTGFTLAVREVVLLALAAAVGLGGGYLGWLGGLPVPQAVLSGSGIMALSLKYLDGIIQR